MVYTIIQVYDVLYVHTSLPDYMHMGCILKSIKGAIVMSHRVYNLYHNIKNKKNRQK